MVRFSALCWILFSSCFVLHSLSAQEAGKTKPAEEAKPQSEEYYELLRLFADTLDQVDRNYVKDVDRRELMEAAIRGMLTKLDPYSNYISPKELDRFRSGVESEFGGVGLQVSNENGVLTVVSPIFNTPAYRAGIQAGDTIFEIEGTSAKGMSLDDAIKRMKGPAGTTVKVKMRRGEEEPKEYELAREVIQVATVLGDRRNEDDTWNYMFDDEKKIAYIRLTSFSRHTGTELKKALIDLKAKGMRGLVLDLRYNPGGLLPVAIEICDHFVAEGKIVSTAGRNTKERVWNAHKEGTFEGFPLAVLINHYSASASEILAACLQDHQRGVIIGERSWGKGSVQNVIELESGKSALKLTTAGYMRPNGKNIHRFEGAKEQDEWGVKPNENFEVLHSDEEQTKLLADRRDRDVIRKPAEATAKERPTDKQLQKALEYLDSQLAPIVKDEKPADAKPAEAKPAEAATQAKK